MRNLDIADSRSKLEQYAAHDQLAAVRGLIGELPPAGAAAIAAADEAEARVTSHWTGRRWSRARTDRGLR